MRPSSSLQAFPQMSHRTHFGWGPHIDRRLRRAQAPKWIEDGHRDLDPAFDRDRRFALGKARQSASLPAPTGDQGSARGSRLGLLPHRRARSPIGRDWIS
jgi:hypothetical protein